MQGSFLSVYIIIIMIISVFIDMIIIVFIIIIIIIIILIIIIIVIVWIFGEFLLSSGEESIFSSSPIMTPETDSQSQEVAFNHTFSKPNSESIIFSMFFFSFFFFF